MVGGNAAVLQEASAESKYLNGLGIARERKAIVDGLRGSVEVFSHEVVGATPKDVMDLILLTQYFGTDGRQQRADSR